MKEAELKADKSLGQHFLINEKTYEKIITALVIKPADTIIEIGPGWGTLTEYLAQTGAQITAIEKDRDLIAPLETLFENTKNVKIVEQDILESNPSSLGLLPHSYKVVGNIPYYITSHLLRTILEQWPAPETIVLMIQKEVAQRIVAKPGELSLLAVSVQYYAHAKLVAKVSASAFYPRPKIDSAIILIKPHSVSEVTEFSEAFFKTVKAGFKEKRKQLINNLSNHLDIDKEVITAKLNQLEINPQRRAQTLSIEEWKKITTILFFPS